MKFVRGYVSPGYDVWKRLSRELGADFRGGGLGGLGDNQSITKRVGNWSLTLALKYVGKAVHTSLIAHYLAGEKLTFAVGRRGRLDSLFPRLAGTSIPLGQADIDAHYRVTGSDPASVAELLRDERIATILVSLRRLPWMQRIAFTSSWSFGNRPCAHASKVRVGRIRPGVWELDVTEPGVVTRPERIRLLFDLIEATLHELRRMGVASDDDPDLASP